MNREQVLAEIEKAQKATPGPWRGSTGEPEELESWWGAVPEDSPECLVVSEGKRIGNDDHPDPICCTNDDGLASEEEYANAIMIASAGTNYLAVLRQLDAAMVDALESSRHTDVCCCVKCEALKTYFGD